MGKKKQPAEDGVTLRGGRTVNFVPRPETFPEEDTNPRGIGLLFRVHSLDSRAMAELAVAAARDLLEFLPDSDEIHLDVAGERTEFRPVDLAAETGLVDSLGEWTALALFAGDEVGRPDFQFRWCITAVKRVAWCDVSLVVKARQLLSGYAGGRLRDCADRFCAAFEVTSGIGVYTRPMDAVPVLRDPDWTTKIQPGWVVQRDRRLEYRLEDTWEMLAAPPLPSPCVHVPDGDGRGYFRAMDGRLGRDGETRRQRMDEDLRSFQFPQPRFDEVPDRSLVVEPIGGIVSGIGLMLRIHSADSKTVAAMALDIVASLVASGLPVEPVNLSTGGRDARDDRYLDYAPDKLPDRWDAPDDWLSLSASASESNGTGHPPPTWDLAVVDEHGWYDLAVRVTAGRMDDKDVARLLLDLAARCADRFDVSSGIGVLSASPGVPHASMGRVWTATTYWAWALQRRDGRGAENSSGSVWDDVTVAGVPQLTVYVPVGDHRGYFELLGGTARRA